jgi:Transposase DDE domain group 1
LRGLTDQMGRFETQWLAAGKNLSTLAIFSGQWVDRVHARRPPRGIVLDMVSSVSPTHGEQENSVWNGHYECTCYHPLFVFNRFGDLNECALRPGNVRSADGWDGVLKPVVARYRGKVSRLYFRADAGFANPEVYEFLEAEGIKYAIRLPANCVLQERIGYLLTRPLGRPPNRRGDIVSISPIKPEAGRSRAGSSPRSNGIRVNFIRASASS